MTTNISQLNRSTTDTALDAPRQPTFRELMRAHKAKEVAAQQPGAVAESLEGRRLYAVTTSLSAGTLTITGTSSAERIEVTQNGSVLSVNVDANATPIATYSTVTDVTTKIVVNAGDGDDTVFFGSSNAGVGGSFSLGATAVSRRCEVDGGTGNDTIDATDQGDSVVGGDGNDTVHGWNGDDTIKGDSTATTTSVSTTTIGYADVLSGDSGDDWVYGQMYYDELHGGNGADHLFGDYVSSTNAGITDANDTLYGDGDPDTIQADCDGVLLGSYGYGGWDVIYGGPNDDWLYGEASPTSSAPGNDTISGGTGADHCYGGYGNDNIFDESSGSADNDADTIYGSDGDDTITLSGGDDRAYGGNGNDTFWGVSGSGNDWIDGEAGSDCILGGSADASDTVLNIP